MKSVCSVMFMLMAIVVGVSGCRSGNGRENKTATSESSLSSTNTIDIAELYREFTNTPAGAGVPPTITNDPVVMDIMTHEKGYKADTQEFLERVKTKTTPRQLQKWALSVLNTHKDDTDSFYLSRKEVPDFVSKLDPAYDEPTYVIVYPKSSVSIVWGGGFGHWGLFVGPTNSPPPDNRKIYWIEWAPGVQAFHDLQ